MSIVTRDSSTRFIEWLSNSGRVIGVLKSDTTARHYPDIHWSKLQLLIIDWADQQCSKTLQSGSPDFFADIDRLYSQFYKHWNKHQLKFFAVYPTARDQWDDTQRDYLPQCLFELLLDDLTGSDNRTEAKMIRPYDRQRVRSNAYELAHYLLNLRQRLDANATIINQPRLTHMLKVYSKERSRPKRNIRFYKAIRDYLLDIQFKELVSKDWAIIQLPQGRDWLLEVWEGFLERIGIKEIAPFQLKCFTTFLNSALLAEDRLKPIMITANTGFGKTEAFLFPILF